VKSKDVGTRKMHADEVDTDVAVVSRLVATQFPQWTDLPLEPVESAGTDNQIYRLGKRDGGATPSNRQRYRPG
jgi:aminoglycoside phosphotransferase (APT) family kinase protein